LPQSNSRLSTQSGRSLDKEKPPEGGFFMLESRKVDYPNNGVNSFVIGTTITDVPLKSNASKYAVFKASKDSTLHD
jgi:hypothetical protein